MDDLESLADAVRARATALRGLGYRVRFECPDLGGCLLIDATGPAVIVEEATTETPADCILRLSAANLARLIDGKLSPMVAFATGKLRVEGSKGVAMKLASLLDAD